MGKDPNKERKAPVLKPVGLDESYVPAKPTEVKATPNPDNTLRASVYHPHLRVVGESPVSATAKKNWADKVGSAKPEAKNHVVAVRPAPAAAFTRNMVAAARRINAGGFEGDEARRFLGTFETAADSRHVRIALETAPGDGTRFMTTLWKKFRHAAYNYAQGAVPGTYDFMIDTTDGALSMKPEIYNKVVGFARHYYNTQRHELVNTSQRMAAE